MQPPKESCWQESGTIALVRDSSHAVLYHNNEFARLIDTEPEKLIGPASGAAFPAFFHKLFSEREKLVQSRAENRPFLKRNWLLKTRKYRIQRFIFLLKIRLAKLSGQALSAFRRKTELNMKQMRHPCCQTTIPTSIP